MATLAERHWQELRPSAAAVRQDLKSPVGERRRPRRERRERMLVRRGR